MAGNGYTLEAALDKLEDLQMANEKAVAETQSVRAKLHSAVRKGKAIEAERASLASKLQNLTADPTKASSVTINYL